jgi:HEPN domain-containing protein
MVCFLSQQIAEKAIKAYLYSRGKDIVYGHSVANLCEQSAEYDTRFSVLRKAIKKLDQYYIEARYPNGLPDSIPADFFEEEDALEAIESARTAVKTVEDMLLR